VFATPVREGLTKIKERVWSFKYLVIPNGYSSKPTDLVVGGFWVFFLLLGWQLYSGLTIIPKPWDITKTWFVVWKENELFWETLISAWLFIKATIITLFLSLILAYSSTIPIFRPFVWLLGKLRYLSLYGLTTAFSLMAVNATSYKISLLVFGMATYFLTSMADIVMSIPESEKNHARSMRFNEWEVVWHVIIVGRRHWIIEILRQNSAMGWMMLTMVEGQSMSQGGLGTMLIKQNRVMSLEYIYAIQFTIFCIGSISDLGLKYLTLAVCPYKRKGKGGLNYAQ